MTNFDFTNYFKLKGQREFLDEIEDELFANDDPEQVVENLQAWFKKKDTRTDSDLELAHDQLSKDIDL